MRRLNQSILEYHFHHHLEPVEAPRLWNLDFSHESLSQVLKHDAVRSGEKCEHVLYEVSFVVVELGPVDHVLTEVDFVHCPEAGHLILVHLPYVIVL